MEKSNPAGRFLQQDTDTKEWFEQKSPSTLQLKVGAQVMLTKNMPEFHLVNGSRGVVQSFAKEHDQDSVAYPVVHFTNGVVRHVKPGKLLF
jgi:ATP-dependent DNA helicase PIF1